MPTNLKLKTKITEEIATTEKNIDIYAGWLGRLENPDPILRTESQGKGLKLYDEVERDPHAASVLQTRYLSVVGKEWLIEPASSHATRGRPRSETQEQKVANFVQNVFLRINFDQARHELLQGILYGFYVWEVMWEVIRDQILIKKLLGKHPRRFCFTKERELRLRTRQNMLEGEPIPERKFVVFTFGSSDNPYGKGLGQKLWWPVWFKKHGIKFWVMFCEKFGSPTAVGKYPLGTSAGDQDKLLDAIEAIQQETGVIIPETMVIELLEAARQSSINTYESLCNYMDAQISKAALGQTASTEGTPGKLGAENIRENVRTDILKADADLLSEVINNTLIPWVVDYNFPEINNYPKFWIRTESEKELKPLAERDKILVRDIGMKISEQYFYDTYNIPKPEEDEELVSPPPAGLHMAESFAGKKKQDNSQKRINTLEEKAINEAIPFFREYIKEIMNLAEKNQSLSNFKMQLFSLQLPTESLIEHLAHILEKADQIAIDSIQEAKFAEAIWGPGTPFEEAIDYFRAKAFTIAGIAATDFLDEVKEEITRAMKEGLTLREFQQTIEEFFDRRGYTQINPWRIETIYRTNLQTAYQAGRYRQMTDPAVMEARPYWRYVAVMDPSTRPNHAAMHGKIFPADHPIWDTWYPGNGYNCRCTVQTLSRREMERNGWEISPEDPTGKLFEPKDFLTGEKLPARPLMPDSGWVGKPKL